MAEVESNPLLKDFYFPPFDSIEAKHVRPGECDLEELERTVEPTWPKLVEPLERIVDRLAVVWGAVSHLKAVKDNADLRSAIEEPEKVAFELKLGQSKPIYNAFKAIRESPNWEALSDARKRIVEAQIKEAVLNGVALEDDKREEFNKIEQELAKLSQKFGENVLDSTKKFEKLITDKKDIEGLPDTALGLAAQTAVSKGHENATAENGPWVITLDAPSFMAVMQHCKNRTLREEVYRAYIGRASSGDLDNTAIIDQILKLRLEKAKLLGYNNYAEVSMATKMATVEKAEELLEKLRSASWNPAVQDMDDLKLFAKNQGAPEADDLNHWDTSFWSERLRESKDRSLMEQVIAIVVSDSDLSREQNVWLLLLANKLFGINVEAADGLAPVRSFLCPIIFVGFVSRFYLASDAWFFADRNIVILQVWINDVRFYASMILQVACCSHGVQPNATRRRQAKPYDLSREAKVETVFHEFGHALQHMLTKQDEGLVAGIRGIEWDAVELPSQFMENWCYHRDTLMGIGKHYETGESIPDDIYEKLLAARTFRAGSLSLRQLRFATLDLELHTKYVPGGSSQSMMLIAGFAKEHKYFLHFQTISSFVVLVIYLLVDMQLDTTATRTIVDWAEVLSADAFSAFEDAGLNNDKAVKETGHRFRETVLALGGGKAPLEVFVEFRGREPSPEPLLRHNDNMSSPFGITAYYFGHVVNNNEKWQWVFSDGMHASGIPITTETSYEELYSKVQKICKVDPNLHDMEMGFISPASIRSFQIPVRITSDEGVQWYLAFNKQGSVIPLCITLVIKNNCDVPRDEHNVVDRDMQLEDGYHNFEVEENNHSDDDRNLNDIWDKLEVIRESPSNDYNGDAFTTPRLDFNQGIGEEN
ncbi:hypothetical protein DH2020_040875 [Rehmannia glutinosa]|uniref:oligopeptidase A n=1 Tax=Rehmannia glutinosa TaxID=99300 RepID=A0ABR0URQ6_REHGL